MRRAGCALLMVLLPAAAWAAGPIVVRLKPVSVIDGERLLLGQLAAIENAPPPLERYLAGLDLGNAPAPGKRQKLKASHVQLRLKQQPLEAGAIVVAGPPLVDVVGRGRVIEGAEAAALVIRHIRETTGWTEEQARVRAVRMPANLYLPPGEIELRIDRVSGDDYGVTLFLLTAWQDNFEVGRLPVSVSIQRTMQAVAAARALAAGETLTAADLTLVPRTITQRADERRYFEDTASLLGQKTRRAVAAGQPLAADMVDNPPLVKRGDSVRVQLVRGGGLAVTTRGIAGEHGRLGQEISVRTDNGKTLRGELRERDLVVVR